MPSSSHREVSDDEKLWRYLPFSRFVWLLQHKKLWLTRVDQLKDRHESTLSPLQYNFLYRRRPITPVDRPLPQETFEQRTRRIVAHMRESHFVSCWSASQYESHALWRIYCPWAEGIAIQTTMGRLRASLPGMSVWPVDYVSANERHPSRRDIAAWKRPMFAYESEVRVVLIREGLDEGLSSPEIGYPIDWDPEVHLESITIHPDADSHFMETVQHDVELDAPLLASTIRHSSMCEPPTTL